MTIRKLFVVTCAICFSMVAHGEDSRKAVLVTGASSGIGLKITELLSAQGYFVYGGARKPADIERLNSMDNVLAVRLDVTVPQDIEAAVELLSREGRGLHGIVNNAGVSIFGPLIETDIKELEFVFDVNVYGPYRITQAFAPLVLAAQGRVINISSVAGTLSPGLFGQYSMSKHAIEAYTDALAAELQPFGVEVSAVIPGPYSTDISKNTMAWVEGGGIEIANSRYADQLRAIAGRGGDRSAFKEPDEVAAAVLLALSEKHPKRRYLVAPDQRSAEVTVRKALEELVQLNEDQRYSYDRDTLVQMLDETLQRSRLARTAE